MTTTRILTSALAALVMASCTTASRPDLSGMSFSSEPLVGKFVWHDLITNDIDAARRFYGELFGWSFEASTGPGGRDYIVARDGAVYVAGLVPVTDRPDGEDVSRWLPYVSVGDVDAALARSIAAGGTVAVGARNVSLGRVAAVIDNQGAVLGLARSRFGDPDDLTTRAAPGRAVWSELLADDPGEAATFYADVVGYQARTIERRGGEYTLLVASSADRAGILEKPADGIVSTWLTHFGVRDPESAARRVEALGGRVLLAPSPELRDGSMAVVTDPAGAVLVLNKITM